MGALYERFAAHAHRTPGAIALIVADACADDETTLDYAALHERVRRCVAGLLAATTAEQRQAPFALQADDGADTIAFVLAINALGASVTPLDPAMPPASVGALCERLGIGLLIQGRDTAQAALEGCDGVAHRLLQELFDAAPLSDGAMRKLAAAGGATDDAYLLTLSSGSTGEPKAVVYTDRGKLLRALHTASAFEVGAGDVMLNASPFHHSLGQRLTFMPLALGIPLVLLRPFSPQSWLRALAVHGVTFTICVSSHLVALQHALSDASVPLHRLRALVSSSASIDAGTKATLLAQARFDFFEMYGASEVATATVLTPRQAAEHPDSVGQACDGVQLRIVDERRRVVGSDELGEIQVRSVLSSPGYHGQPELSATAFADGWFRTGDLGRLDADGFLHFVDRRSDIIVTGGTNVHPSEIERCACRVQGVSDCLALGVPDVYLGEAVIGVVRTDSHDTAALERALRDAVRQALPPSRRPLAWFFRTELPLGATGKIDRRALRAEYAARKLDLSGPFRAVRNRAA